MNLSSKLLLTSVLVVSFISNTYAVSWEEEFEKFQKSHTLSLQNAIQGITEYQNSYLTPKMKDGSPKERDQAIKLFAVNQVLAEEIDAKAGAIERWITSSGYKNYPDLKSDDPKLIAFSNHYKKTVSELRTLTKETKEFPELAYSQIQEGSIDPLKYLQRVEASIGIVTKAKSIVDQLPPSVKEWDSESEIKKPNPLMAFLEQDQFTLNVLNKAYEMFGKGNAIDVNSYTAEILKSVDLEGHEDWRKEESVRQKITQIVYENFVE